MIGVIKFLLILLGAVLIVVARVKGVHLTEGELLLEYWYLFAAAIGLMALALLITYFEGNEK